MIAIGAAQHRLADASPNIRRDPNISLLTNCFRLPDVYRPFTACLAYRRSFDFDLSPVIELYRGHLSDRDRHIGPDSPVRVVLFGE
jgi:hypothetical protein